MDTNNGYNEFTNTEKRDKIETAQFKCPSCGNNLEFDPDTQKLKCAYCGTTIDIEDVARAEENPFAEGTINGFYNKDVEVYRCQNCGALSEKSPDGLAFECPYCKKTNVVLEEDIKGIKPTGVVPFKVDKEDAATKTKKWIKSRFYAPRKIKKSDFNTLLKGIYSPCWTFDSYTYSVYKGRVGKYVTRTVGSGKNRHTVTEIRWQNVSGEINMNFDDLKIYAGTKISDKAFGKVADYDTNLAAKYDKSYLAGFTAMHYTLGIDEAWNKAKGEMNEKIKSAILSRYNADVVDYLHINTSHAKTSYKYLLLPFYLGSYSFSQKPYAFIVNGVTGKVWGKYPKSPLKIILTVLLGLAIVAAIAYFVLYAQI